MNNFDDQGYVLHCYRYRETSAIVEMFTAKHGRIAIVARGVKAPKSKLRSVLQPFLKLAVQAKGKSSLKTLAAVDPIAAPLMLSHTRLVSGLYINELLVRLVHKDEPCERLYAAYEQALHDLVSGDIAVALRRFEQELIDTLGYQLPLQFEADSRQRIQADMWYQFVPEHGFVLSEEPGGANVFLGEHLLAIKDNDFSIAATQQTAKQLFRLVLTPLLGAKPLKSREIIKALLYC